MENVRTFCILYLWPFGGNIVYWTHAKFKFTWLPKWFWTISTIIHVFSRCWSHWFGWKTYEGCIKYKQNGNQLGVSTCKTYQGKKPIIIGQIHLEKPSLSRTAGRPCSGSCVRHLRWGVALLVQMGLGSVCGVWGGGNCNPNIVGKWHVRLLVSFTCRDFYWLVVHSCFCGCAETTELRTVGCIRSSWFKPHHLSFVVGWIWEPWSVGKPRAQVVNQFKDRSSAECGCRMRMDEVD